MVSDRFGSMTMALPPAAKAAVPDDAVMTGATPVTAAPVVTSSREPSSRRPQPASPSIRSAAMVPQARFLEGRLEKHWMRIERRVVLE